MTASSWSMFMGVMLESESVQRCITGAACCSESSSRPNAATSMAPSDVMRAEGGLASSALVSGMSALEDASFSVATTVRTFWMSGPTTGSADARPHSGPSISDCMALAVSSIFFAAAAAPA